MVVTTSALSIAPLRAERRRRRRPVSRGRAALEVLEHEGAPGLHPVDDRRDLRGSAKLPRELVRLPDRDRAPVGVGDVHGAQVDAPDVGRVVVQQPDELELGLEVRDELLAPLAPQAPGEIAVARD